MYIHTEGLGSWLAEFKKTESSQTLVPCLPFTPNPVIVSDGSNIQLILVYIFWRFSYLDPKTVNRSRYNNISSKRERSITRYHHHFQLLDIFVVYTPSWYHVYRWLKEVIKLVPLAFRFPISSLPASVMQWLTTPWEHNYRIPLGPPPPSARPCPCVRTSVVRYENRALPVSFGWNTDRSYESCTRLSVSLLE